MKQNGGLRNSNIERFRELNSDHPIFLRLKKFMLQTQSEYLIELAIVLTKLDKSLDFEHLILTKILTSWLLKIEDNLYDHYQCIFTIFEEIAEKQLDDCLEEKDMALKIAPVRAKFNKCLKYERKFWQKYLEEYLFTLADN